MDVLAAAATSGNHQSTEDMHQGPSYHHSSHQNSGLSALLNAATLQLDDEQHKAKGHHLSAGIYSAGTTEQQSSFNGTNGHTQPPSVEVKRSFPGILMTLLLDDNNSETLTFLPDGKFFAILMETFCETFLDKHFDGLSADEFVGQLATHGFTRIDQGSSHLQVFRHKLFCKDDWEQCAMLLEEIDHGSDSLITKANLLSPPPRLVSTSTSDGSITATTCSKRRMSPSHEDDRVIESPVDLSCSSDDAGSRELATLATCCSSSIATLGSPTVSTTADATNYDCQSRARVIFEEKMSLNECSSCNLQQQAVAHATRNIVTGAIETLLHDEDHTREIFEKHNESLSKARVPGVLPIALQLFSSRNNINKKKAATKGAEAVSNDKTEAS